MKEPAVGLPMIAVRKALLFRCEAGALGAVQ